MQNDSDAVDFKPFLDAVVGILFILLILITAQMFFNRWADVVEDAARDRNREARLAWENEATVFLNDLADRFRAIGTNPVVDLRAKSISLPLSDLAQVGIDHRPRINPVTAHVGRLLAEHLLCLGGTNVTVQGNCPKLDILRLGRLESQLHVGAPQGGDLPADAYAYYFSIIFSAKFVDEAPGLLAIRDSSGGPAVQALTRAAAVGPPFSGQSQEGYLTLQFLFDGAPTQPK